MLENGIRISMGCLVLLLIMAWVVLPSGWTVNAESRPIYVAQSVSGGGSCVSPDYNTIQAAVDAAVPGNTLIVCGSRYQERVVLHEKYNNTIRADKNATVVVSPRTLRGKAQRDVSTLSRSNQITIEGLQVTGGSRTGFFLMGGDNFNRDINLAANEIYGKGLQCQNPDCGGIVIGDGNARTWVVSNLIRGNQTNGMWVGNMDSSSYAPVYAVNNTIVHNGSNGLSVSPQRFVCSVNNPILKDGACAGKKEGVSGIRQVGSRNSENRGSIGTVSFLERTVLNAGLLFEKGSKTNSGDGSHIGIPGLEALDSTASENYTTLGTEGFGETAGCAFTDCSKGHGLDEFVEDSDAQDHHLVAGLPASGMATGSFLDGGREWVPSVDFEGEPRPRGGVDIGYDQMPPADPASGSLLRSILQLPQLMFFKFSTGSEPRGSVYHRFANGPGISGKAGSNSTMTAAQLEPLASGAPIRNEAVGAQVEGARRVGIVYSQATALRSFDELVYSQLFMAMQNQVIMAGIPFDLLTENDLTNVSKISSYDALVFPHFVNCCVNDLDEDVIAANIQAAVANSGVGIITSGDFMTNDEDGVPFPTPPFSNPYQHMIDVLGLSIIGSVGPADFDALARGTLHPVMKNYGANEIILGKSLPSHPPTFNDYSPRPSPYIDYFTNWYGDAGAGAVVIPLVDLVYDDDSGPQSRDGVLAIEKDGGRHVHFANDWLMGDSNLVWEALQWSIYGNGDTPVGLNIGRQESIFIARDDEDLSKNPPGTTDVADHVLSKLKVLFEDWKDAYNFVGSNYINIGNKSPDELIDWSFSAPFFQHGLALGHEIGTHTYTHPLVIDQLTQSQLQFEFCDSKTEIESQLGITILGGSVPGAAESLKVDKIIDQLGCLSYLSGRFANVGIGFPGAIGYLNANPTEDMVYFNLNMWPDFTAIQWHGWTAAQTEQEWARQMDFLKNHASQPIFHMLWHDYGPTTAASDIAFCTSFPGDPACVKTQSGYTVQMYGNTLKKAYDEGTEFANLVDIYQRFEKFRRASLEVTHAVAAPGEETITATVGTTASTGSGVGNFSLRVNTRDSENKVIKSVDNWYAYSGDRVFLDVDGGRFAINLGASGTPQDEVTRIVSLPMRAVLQSVSGDGINLDFTLVGEGEVSVHLNPSTPLEATCDGTTTQKGNVMEINFGNYGTHTCQVGVPVADVKSPVETIPTPSSAAED